MRLVGDEENCRLGRNDSIWRSRALSLQNLNDLPGALVQLRRVLKPDGLFPRLLSAAKVSTSCERLGRCRVRNMRRISPRVAPFADVRDMGGLMQRAGFALPVADSEPVTVRYADMFGLMKDLRAMGAANALVRGCGNPRRRAFYARRESLLRTDSPIRTDACAQLSR